MTIDADTLLSGPRGRRAALLIASQSSGDQWLTSRLVGAIMELGGEFDDPSGARRQYVRFRADDAASPESELPEIETPDDLAAALLDAPIRAELIDPLEALDVAVSSARYWQAPDGEEVLAALPAMREALVRAAEVLLSRPETDWWDEPVARSEQWAVDFDFGEGITPRTGRPDVGAFRAKAVAEEEQARADRPVDPTYPFSGSWWSTPLVWNTSFTTTRALGEAGPVGLHLIEDSMGWQDAVARPVTIDASARVFEIAHEGDWAELCRRFPLEVTASRRHDWYRATGRIGTWVIPDWTAVAEHFDGVHLSAAGYLRAAGRAVAVDADSASVIAGWNPDETWWFRPDAIAVNEETRIAWHEAHGEGWRRR